MLVLFFRKLQLRKCRRLCKRNKSHLPTNGYARNYSGVSLDSFVKKITFQEITKNGIQNIGPAIELMAEAENLFAHKNAVSLRLNK